MAHPMTNKRIDPAKGATVVYVPESQILYLENGRIRESAEEMARQVVVYYDKEDESTAVAVRIDSTEAVLKSFMDAILAKHGIMPVPNAPPKLHKKGSRETVIDQIRNKEIKLAPFSEATYCAASQTLLVENGEICTEIKELAKDVHVLYGRDYDGGEWLATVGIRIEQAETVLKPFVDAILAKHGVTPEQQAAAG